MSSFIEDKPIRDGLEAGDMLRMNVGQRWWYCRLSDIPDSLVYKDILNKYLLKLSTFVRRGYGLLFHGELSTGKTAAAIIAAKAVVCHGGTAFFIPVSELSDLKIDKARFDEQTTIWQRMLDVDLLILDDLGAEHGSPWAVALAERVIRLRSNSRKSIVATTNRFADLKAVYGDSTLAILRSVTYPVLVEGKNWRDDESSELKRELFA